MKIFKLTVFVFSFLLISGVKSQVNLDSLLSVWNDTTQADTNRIKAMKRASSGYLYSQSDSAFFIL